MNYLYEIFGLNFSIGNKPCEILERPVVGTFGIGRETARRQLAASQMICNTIAADSFSPAWLVGAVAFGQYRFFFTFHFCLSH